MLSILRRFKRKIKRVLTKCRIIEDFKPKDYYISKISKKAPWVYVAYIEHPFYHQNEDAYLDRHQNMREAIAQVEIFNELGYNVYVQNYLSKGEIPKYEFSIVFGHEPNFTKVAIANPRALKVHYVPGAYIEHRNGQIIRMTDYFNKTYHANVPYRRLLEYDNQDYASPAAYEIADSILMIGSKFTIETFPPHLRSKITLIHQSTQKNTQNTEIKLGSNKDFFFMGSGGNLLKGISLLIEYFTKHPENNLHIVGPIEDDVKKAISCILTDNIKFYGFVNANSETMSEIMGQCNFIIYPSGSEGSPGAVLNSMKTGLIPIVTRWSAFDEIESYGYVLENWDVASISKGIEWSHTLSDERILELKQNCARYVTETYNLDKYKREFKDYFTNIITQRN